MTGCFCAVGSQAWMLMQFGHPGLPFLGGSGTALMRLVVCALPGVTPGLSFQRCDVLVESHGDRRGTEPPAPATSSCPVAAEAPAADSDPDPKGGGFCASAVLMMNTAVRSPPSGFVQTSTWELFPSP